MASENNPLLQHFVFPPFDAIEPKHVRPAILSLLNKIENDLVELEGTLEPTWQKLVEPLEKITDRLSVVWGIVNHLSSVKDSPELRSAIEEVQPEKVKFQLRLSQSKGIYSAFKAIRDSSDWESLSDARKRIVEDSCGSPLAYFYFDPYSRPSEKRGGAWVSEVVGRSKALSHNGTSTRLPISHIVCNQTPPLAGKPSLMTFREVQTVFHEFGHALQQMLTKQDEGLVSGSRGIEWDAVELASQFMENWCYQRNTLISFAKHYETGECLPEEIYSKIISGRTFLAGSELLRQNNFLTTLRFASVDMELHTNYVPGGSETVYDIDQRVGRRMHVIPLLPEDRFLCSFSHIFSDEYAAGYYSYQWAEVLSFDAFSAFEEAGLNDDMVIREKGRKFRDTVLALGGGKSPLEVFIEFRGREPSPEAMLRYNGLLQSTAATKA